MDYTKLQEQLDERKKYSVSDAFDEIQANIRSYDELSRRLYDSLETEDESEVEPSPSSLLNVISSHLGKAFVTFCYMVIVLHFAVNLYYLYLSVRYIRVSFVEPDFCVGIWLALPFIVWLFSTTRWAKDWKDFHNKKLFGIRLAVVNITFSSIPLIYRLSFNLFIPLVLKIPVSRDITPEMILNLGRVLCCLPLVLPFALTLKLLEMLRESRMREAVLAFRLDRNWDLRPNKKHLYDLHFFRRLTDGSIVRQDMHDRYVHQVFDGATGTGKTSMCLSRTIVDDLTRKAKNLDMLMKITVRALKSGAIKQNEAFDRSEFSVSKFTVIDKRKAKKWLKACDKYLNCGITAVAPNAAFADEIYDFARKKGFKVNRIDPTLNDKDQHKAGYVGFNPLYVNPAQSSFRINQEIIRNARIFADVLEALNEEKGTGDPYFSSLNRLLTTTVSTLVMKAYPLLYDGRQPNLRHVQEVLCDFSRAKEYYDVLNAQDDEVKIRYRVVLDIVKNQMLDKDGSKKIKEHSTGLLVTINNFLGQELIANVLCAENTVNLDKALAEGQITVVNFALELSQDDAKVFGNFFLLNFIAASLRRPKNNRIPHFLFIDEFPVIVTKGHQPLFTLLRQYKVATSLAIQNLGQLSAPALRSIREAVVSAGMFVIYGRAGKEEIETFLQLGKESWNKDVQIGYTTKSLLRSDTDNSKTKRVSFKKELEVTGSDMRYQEFQHAYVHMVKGGAALPPFLIKTDFLSDFQTRAIKRFKYDFVSSYDKYGIHTSETIDDSLRDENVDENSVLVYDKTDIPIVECGTVKASGTSQKHQLDDFVSSGKIVFEGVEYNLSELEAAATATASATESEKDEEEARDLIKMLENYGK